MTEFDRRSVLTGVGAGLAGAVAGCRFPLGGEEPTTFDIEAVDAVVSSPAPRVDDPVPVGPAEPAVGESLDRVDELLADLPDDFDAERVPNGVIRREIRHLRERAGEARDALTDGRPLYHRLRDAPGVRGDAAEAAVAYRAARDDVDLASVRAERDDRATEIDDALDAVADVGDDRPRALYLASELESALRSAATHLDRGVRAVEPSALDVGELGSAVEYGRATNAVVAHLAARHRERLSDSRALGSAFESALDRSVAAAESRDVPAADAEPGDLVDRDVDESPAERLLPEAHWRVRSSSEELYEARDAGHLGRGLRAAYEFETAVRAFEAVRERTEAGDFESLSEVSTIETARAEALKAVDEVPIDPAEPSIPAALLADVTADIRTADDWLRRGVEADRDESDGGVSAASLHDEYVTYVLSGQRLTALPDAVSAVADRFDA